MIQVVQAWVKDSPNVVPLAQLESRSTMLARETAALWRRAGFRVERFSREEDLKKIGNDHQKTS